MQHHVLTALLLYRLCSLPPQILMSVSWVVSMTVMEMLTASIPLEVTTAAVTLAMREMDSTAQVTQSCEVHTTHCQWYSYVAYLWFTVTRCLLFPDMNECQLGTDLCVNAECNNTAGSYTCRPCFPGFIPGNLTSCSEFHLCVYSYLTRCYRLHACS